MAEVWEKAHHLTLETYRVTANAELARFCGIARGSASQLEYR